LLVEECEAYVRIAFDFVFLRATQIRHDIMQPSSRSGRASTGLDAMSPLMCCDVGRGDANFFDDFPGAVGGFGHVRCLASNDAS
jgi:hypothetical protein